MSHLYSCDLKLPEALKEGEDSEIDEEALEEHIGREIPSEYKEQVEVSESNGEDSCFHELSSLKSAYGQFVFSIDSKVIDPCHIKGYVVGFQDELKVKRSHGGFYFIDFIPAGKHDIIIELDAVESPEYSKSLALRIEQTVFVNGIRLRKEALELPEAGQITGHASLIDAEDHEGIRVYIPGTNFEALTKEDGSYSIEPYAPVGTNSLMFEKEGYHLGQIEAISVESAISIPTFDIKLEIDGGEEGFLFLADKREEYSSRTVPVSVGGGKDARFMKISEDSLFENASWQPVVSSSFFTFDSEGQKTLYLKFLNVDGLESQVYEDSVTVVVAESNQEGLIKQGAWTQLSSENAPASRSSHAAVWTGSSVFIWGGNAGGDADTYSDGFLFDPFSNAGGGTWQKVSSDFSPQPRYDAGAVWTGNEVFLWGGVANSEGILTLKGDGGSFDPSSNSWNTIATLNAPSSRYGHLTVMGSGNVYIWGGVGSVNIDSKILLGDGAFYDPLNDSWTPLPQADAPSAREKFSGVWINDKLMIWGGVDGSSSLNDGAIYDPGLDVWSQVTTVNAPSARHEHNMVWTGEKVLVWGGQADNQALASGALYDPDTDTWTPISMESAPSARFLASGIWTGEEFMVWGGRVDDGSPFLNTGGIYSPATDTWQQLAAYDSLLGRSNHGAVWTGRSVLVWGGEGLGTVFSDGAQYGLSVDESGAENP